jgi:hypothetical protein
MNYRWVLFITLAVIGAAFFYSQEQQVVIGQNSDDRGVKQKQSQFDTSSISKEPANDKRPLNQDKALEPAANLKASKNLFFQDNPKKMNIATDLRRPQNARSALLPKSDSELQPSELWENGDWQIWKGVRVLGSHDLTEEQQDPRQQLGSFGNKIFIQDAEYINNEHQFASAFPMPVFNKKRNRMGLVFGVFTIHLRHQQDLENVLAENDLNLKAEISSINTYYVEAKTQPFDLVSKLGQLKNDPRIVEVALEIVSQVHASN